MNFIKKHLNLILSGCIPACIMLAYFIYRGFAPFGSSSLLTVDMGQQYVAFYEYFRSTILGHPGQFFYSFSNGLGGDMFGTWTYYLLSPTNLVLLFFKKESVTTGILVVTVLKYALAGLTSAIYLQHRVRESHVQSTRVGIAGFATAYSLMAFTIANQLNLFWLDAPILLPLIILGLDYLIDRDQVKIFVITMSCMLIINYYFAYMIGIFTVIYFLWYASPLSWTKIFRFIQSWIYVLIFSAISWMPTLWALIHGKAQYTENTIKWAFTYSPLKMLTKLMPGTFSFKQMSDGLPNIYVGMFVLMAFIAYFFNKEIGIKRRIGALVVTLFFLLSFCFTPLNLVWHAMQFPWWYAYRFSFIFSFWVIILAFEGLLHPIREALLKPIIAGLAVISIITYVSTKNLTKISDFMTNNQIQFGVIIFIAAVIFWVGFQAKEFNHLLTPILICFMAVDLSVNAVWSLNRISYVSQTEFSKYSAAARSATNEIQARTTNFTRIGTNYSRTKNDPIQLGFNGGSSFNSNLETNMLDMMSALGQPTTSGNVSYMNGTLISDALLDFKYWSFVDEQAANSPFLTKSVRHDVLKRYHRIGNTKYAENYLNQYALPLGITTSQPVSNAKKVGTPLEYQSNLLQKISNRSENLFTDITNQAGIYFSNVTSTTNIKNGLLTKQKLNKSASVTFEFVPSNNNPIYITAGSQLSHNNADIFVNNQRISEDIDYDQPVILSIADQMKGKKVRIQIVLKKQSLLLSDFSVAELGFNTFKQDYQVAKTNSLTNVKNSGNVVTGDLNVNAKKTYLFTSIPYSSGWHIKVDGKKITSSKVGNYFLGSSTKLPAGKHHVKFTYIPPFFMLGMTITCLGLLLWILILFQQKKIFTRKK
jgi:uncharacterized membrane protein YfhO